jgi:hypothetical protein
LDRRSEPTHARRARLSEPLSSQPNPVNRSEFDGRKIRLAHVAQWTAPRVRDIGEPRACHNAFFRHAIFFVVNPSTNQANPAFIFDHFAHDRLFIPFNNTNDKYLTNNCTRLQPFSVKLRQRWATGILPELRIALLQGRDLWPIALLF